MYFEVHQQCIETSDFLATSVQLREYLIGRLLVFQIMDSRQISWNNPICQSKLVLCQNLSLNPSAY